jgi:hypothetical protein
MALRRWNRAAALALTAAVALTVPVAASAGERAPARRAGRQAATARAPQASLLVQAWSWLSVLWAKEGVLIDPDGARLRDSAWAKGDRDSSPLTTEHSGQTPVR